MKDLLRMVAYSAIGIVMIALLIKATSSDISAGAGVALALLLVVVLPIALIIALSRRDNPPS